MDFRGWKVSFTKEAVTFKVDGDTGGKSPASHLYLSSSTGRSLQEMEGV